VFKTEIVDFYFQYSRRMFAQTHNTHMHTACVYIQEKQNLPSELYTSRVGTDEDIYTNINWEIEI